MNVIIDFFNPPLSNTYVRINHLVDSYQNNINKILMRISLVALAIITIPIGLIVFSPFIFKSIVKWMTQGAFIVNIDKEIKNANNFIENFQNQADNKY